MTAGIGLQVVTPLKIISTISSQLMECTNAWRNSFCFNMGCQSVSM